jgi:MoaA/NifB/PqqE/SkfB family radical SAM enzyme
MTPPSHPFGFLERGGGRPVRRRTRTFRPNYLSFAGTYQCNLSCPHCCVPIEWPDRLDVEVALTFLEDAFRSGVEILGFTGGEPFLYPEFLFALTRRASSLGMRFDKVQTNGVWFRDEPHLVEILSNLRDAGFTGKLGLSVDKFHGSHTEQAADFCRVARKVFDRGNIVSLSYASRSPEQGLEPVRALARLLDGVIDWSDWLNRYLLVSPELTIVLNWNHLAPVERAERFSGAWDGTWFEEDYCEGPGQALIVTPKGEVKPCCGFASDLEQLTIGNIHRDSVGGIIRRARKHPYVGKVFREGLTAIREEILARDPQALPGATSNHCYFCWYVLTRNLVTLPAGFPGTSPPGRVSLPLAGDGPSPPVARPGESATALLMAFDGKTVFLGRELSPDMPLGKGRVYLVNIAGPSPVEPPPEKMTWTDYQLWIDRLRGDGYTLTTHNFSPCQK